MIPLSNRSITLTPEYKSIMVPTIQPPSSPISPLTYHQYGFIHPHCTSDPLISPQLVHNFQLLEAFHNMLSSSGLMNQLIFKFEVSEKATYSNMNFLQDNESKLYHLLDPTNRCTTSYGY